MTTWEPRSTLAKAVVAAGFWYDPAQDIIYSRMNAWQRNVGYTWAYDVSSAPLQMIIDCEPFYFRYKGKLWMIELWKGQYGLETGCEIGVYQSNLGFGVVPGHARSVFFACVGDADRLMMKFTLFRKGERLLHRGPESHWWLTGFRWGVFTGSTLDLTMDVEIVFPTTEMRDAFEESAQRNRYHTRQRDPVSIAFTFRHPHTQQPAARAALEGGTQARNEELVGAYDLLRKALKIPNNDPNAFSQLDGLAREAASLVSGPVTTVTNAAPARPRRAGGAAHVNRILQSDALTRIRRSGVSEAAWVAYHEVLTSFEKKSWHVTSNPGSFA